MSMPAWKRLLTVLRVICSNSLNIKAYCKYGLVSVPVCIATKLCNLIFLTILRVVLVLPFWV